ncbi:MAG TPA: hypothetical protein PKD86_05965 [Gemmatales bacterium]|nr:hypothetical protein [Gemmatales bacterium]HMP58880.1 hypothetical protein [Gemmatales bacterium]
MSWTCLALMALWPISAKAAPGPVWHADYREGMKIAARLDRSVAVVVGRGSVDSLLRNGAMPAEAQKLLAEHYVCIFVDQEAAEGKRLAKEFNATGQTVLVISDKTRQVQAVRKVGPLQPAEVTTLLATYKTHNMQQRPTTVPSTLTIECRT